MHDLFIIEAPGKRLVLQETLKSIGIEAKVQATTGHLFSMPKPLTPLGIDSTFRPFKRELIDPQIGKYVRDAVAEAKNVFVATDADLEGDVIAWDVAELIRDLCPEPMRVKLKGMDADSVREAIENAVPVSKEDAVPGRTRAIVDRMIGGTLSNNGVRVGRIVTALLGIVNSEVLPTSKVRLVAPAADNGRPWVAEFPVAAPISAKMAAELVKVDFPPLDKRRSSKPYTSKPKHMGDILVRAGEVLNISPGKAAKSMQTLYEAGKLSYPRAGSNGLSKAAADKIAGLVKNSGYHMEAAKVAEKKEGDVHDSPYPIGKVNVTNDPNKLGWVEGLRTMVARDLVKTGQEHVVQEAFGVAAEEHLKKLGYSDAIAKFVGELPWRREVGPAFPGQTKWPSNEVVILREDSVLLQAAIKKGLGRPSSWGTHIDKFMEDELVDEDLKLTEKGKYWVAHSPAVLLDPRISVAIENACERVPEGVMDDPNREPWELLAERIITALPVSIKQPLVSAIENERPRPKVDPTAMFRETVGLDEVLEKSKENTFTYAPKKSVFED